jgi:hypothetical protein
MYTRLRNKRTCQRAKGQEVGLQICKEQKERTSLEEFFCITWKNILINYQIKGFLSYYDSLLVLI